MSDKLQEIKQAFTDYDLIGLANHEYDKDDAGIDLLKMVVEYVPTLIEQLEQAQNKLEECMQSHERMEVECQRLKKDKLLLHAVHDENYAKACERQGIIEELQAANQKLVECLEWYEDEVQYRQELYYLDGDINEPYYECPEILEDGGQRARTVLQEVQHGTSKETDSKS